MLESGNFWVVLLVFLKFGIGIGTLLEKGNRDLKKRLDDDDRGRWSAGSESQDIVSGSPSR